MTKRATHQLFHYQLPLKTGGIRRGLLLCVQQAQGDASWGEIAPLEGWSKETLEEAEREVVRMQPLCASAMWGLETALLPPPAPRSVPFCGLLQAPTSEAILEQAQHLVSLGVTHAKVKLSPFSDPEAHRLLRQLREHFTLRVDLNRKWSLTRSCSFFSRYSATDFEYIEEPASDPLELADFPLPFALDESIRETPIHKFAHFANLCALIIKPTLMGGASTLAPLAHLCKCKGWKWVVSSSFESGIGIAHLMGLCGAFSLPVQPASVGTWSWLAEDLLATPLRIEGGKLHLDAFSVCKERLQNAMSFA